MRIAYVLTSLGIGGAERQALALAERMAARGHAVALLVLRGRQPEQWPTTLDPVYFDMRKTPVSLLAGWWKGLRFLRDFQPDLIHSHTYPANMMARLLKILHPGAAVFSTIHNVYEGRWPRMMAYRLTDGLSLHTTAVSQAAADRFVRLRAVPAGKLSILANGIDTMEFSLSPERRAHMREEMGAGDEFIWLTAGRIVPAKDYPNLLRAFARVTTETVPRRGYGLAGEGLADALEAFQLRWQASWACASAFAGWVCAAICPPCWTPPTALCWLRPGRECRWPWAKRWPWRSRLWPPMWAACASWWARLA
jgi:glycosyltransferase involved in cell wall biosynthesis